LFVLGRSGGGGLDPRRSAAASSPNRRQPSGRGSPAENRIRGRSKSGPGPRDGPGVSSPAVARRRNSSATNLRSIFETRTRRMTIRTYAVRPPPARKAMTSPTRMRATIRTLLGSEESRGLDGERAPVRMERAQTAGCRSGSRKVRPCPVQVMPLELDQPEPVDVEAHRQGASCCRPSRVPRRLTLGNRSE